jgi:MFS family permease
MALNRDGKSLFITRFIRLFSYGMLAVVLVFYLTGLGLSESQTGLLLTLTLAGDTVISLVLTTQADRFGRRRILVAGAILMAGAGIAFSLTRSFVLLVVAGTLGVISPSGNEVGPFLSVEQAALSEVISSRERTSVFAWYALTGSIATALGSLFGGVLTDFLHNSSRLPAIGGERVIVFLYAAMGIVLVIVFSRLSLTTEVQNASNGSGAMMRFLGIRASRPLVFRLGALFALDAFGGGFVVQSFAAYWFYLRFGVDPATLGGIFFGANLFAGISALLASRIAARIGLVRTMVFTHLPSSILLILVPLMPTLQLAIAVLLARFSISQMDVPTRQSYTMAIVAPEERSAAAGITGVARTTGASLAPFFAGHLFARPELINLPFFIAGTLKIAYDLLLYRAFVSLRPPEEDAAAEPSPPTSHDRERA